MSHLGGLGAWGDHGRDRTGLLRGLEAWRILRNWGGSSERIKLLKLRYVLKPKLTEIRPLTLQVHFSFHKTHQSKRPQVSTCTRRSCSPSRQALLVNPRSAGSL